MRFRTCHRGGVDYNPPGFLRRAGTDLLEDIDDPPNIEGIYVGKSREKPHTGRRLVYFHESLESSGIYRPPFDIGKHIVIIVIRQGSGFALLYKGSHASGQGNANSTSTGSIGE